MSSDSDADDWFTKDEDEIVKELQSRTRKSSNSKSTPAVEEIVIAPSATESYRKQNFSGVDDEHSIEEKKGTKLKVTTADLRRITQLDALDAFLYVSTQYDEVENFFAQIGSVDALDRVLLYIRILKSICGLEIPGFHEELLRCFVAQKALLEHFRVICMKLFDKRYKSMWKSLDVDEIVHNMQMLLLQVHKARMMTPKVEELLQDIRAFVKKSNSPSIAELSVCVEFAHHLDCILDEGDGHVSKRAGVQIFPTLEELLDAPCSGAAANTASDGDTLEEEKCLEETDTTTLDWFDLGDETKIDSVNEAVHTIAEVSAGNLGMHEEERKDDLVMKDTYANVYEYINTQKHLLREDFMISLRQSVSLLKRTKSPEELPKAHPPLLDGVEIVLNDQYLTAHRHEMLFVDVYGGRRNQEKDEDTTGTARRLRKASIRAYLWNVKTGALLCLTTDYEFENLILAMVTYNELDTRRDGYIGIEIVAQYNIGSIYNKSLLMFETPAFFEPYHNVYNFLSTCNMADFSMNKYIVFGENETKAPAYLNNSTSYKYGGETFKPLQKPSPLKKIPLDHSQLEAYQSALAHDLCLIQGPPGTGKTHLSVQLVQTLIENANKAPVVLVTYTNDSLDKFLLKLSGYTHNIVRFGRQSRQPEIAKFNVSSVVGIHLVNPRLKRVHYLVNLELKVKFEELQTLQKYFDGSDENYHQIVAAQRAVRAVMLKLNSLRVMFQFYMARQSAIIAMTTTCAAKTNFLFRLLRSSIVIFEEAGEILESHALACLTPHTEHIIMIGDHMQLKPYTSSYQHSRSSKLNISLFERLISRGFQPAALSVQYRMRPAIAALICPSIYAELSNDSTVESYPEVRKMRKNVFFVNHENREERQSKCEPSIYNSYEADVVLELARYLVKKAGYAESDIVILSPYAQQIELIREKLAKYKLHKLNASTVDSYQGLEANIVLLSLVRNNLQNQIGFLKEKNRICVALSRAKYGLYIMGNIDMLAASSKTWKAIKKVLEKQNVIDIVFPFNPDA